jgi:DNA-binding SARP family transcriptional activator
VSLSVQLLGSPRVLVGGEDRGKPRGAKSWALLALLARSEGPLPRSRVAELLFSEADDPLGALRWTASQVRRLLDSSDTVVGDPLELRLPDDAVVDVDLVLRGQWEEAIDLPGLGRPLLEGVDPRAGASFELWLAGERRHLEAAAAALAHEAASVLLARGETGRAVTIAELLVGLDPYDENAQVLLARSLIAGGDREAAEERVRVCTELFREELGVAPSAALAAAVRARREPVRAGPATLKAQLEAGQAAMTAGAVDAGLETLRGVGEGALALGDEPLAVSALFALGVALVHTTRGTDEEAISILHQARDLAQGSGDDATAAAACRELGYVEFLRGRYDRAALWLADAREQAEGDVAELAWVELVSGSCLSDAAHYTEGERSLRRAVELAGEAEDRRAEAFAMTHLSRLLLLRGELDEARDSGRSAIALAQDEGWMSFVPYPETWTALADLGLGQLDESHEVLEHAWAMACQIGDPCWQTLSLRGLGLVSATRDLGCEALDQLEEAPSYCRGLPDAYRWAEAYALESLVAVSIQAGDDRAPGWLAQLGALSDRCGFRELQVRTHLHQSRLGEPDAWKLAAMLVAEIDNPLLADQVALEEPATA